MASSTTRNPIEPQKAEYSNNNNNPHPGPSPRNNENSSNENSNSDKPSSSSTTTAKPKKKLNRQLASCSGCRKRRTRCDRGRPCSECHKRNLTCDYSGASAPPSIPHHSIAEQVEREEYIKKLEARIQALEKNVSSSNKQPSKSSDVPLDFSVDDLAAQLSVITIGQRVRCPTGIKQPPHPLRTQLESILASQSKFPPITFIQPEQQFSLDLVARYPIPTLEELCSECLPARSQIDFLSGYFFNTLNLWSPSINAVDWKIQLDTFLSSPDRLQFRPSPCPPNPLHHTKHYLAQFVSILYGIIGHGLARVADIHNLESVTENQSSGDSPASSPPRDYHLWSLSQADKISLSNRWFRFSLGLLMSSDGNIYIKPTVFGIRAMSILSNVEHAPENLDHGMIFWSLTSSLAMSVGLFREPPVSEDEDYETLDATELESRRHLAWAILGLDWAGQAIANGMKPHVDPDQITVEFPGNVISPATSLHPIDGWPLDPLVCIRKIAAQSDRLMRKASIKISSGHPATYQDVLEAQKQLDELESTVPPRLQMKISDDGKSIETVVQSDPVYTLLAAFLYGRFCVPRIRLLRLFIFPKRGVSPEERLGHLEMLLIIAKRHFLAIHHHPHDLCMHPLILYGFINTAVACALLLLINHQTHELVIDEGFYLTELRKVIAIFDLGKKTVAVTMSRKAVALLQTLINQAELLAHSTESKSWDRRKKGPGATVQLNQNLQCVDHEEEVKKHKQQPKLHSKPYQPVNFRPLLPGFGIPSQELSQPAQHDRQESGQSTSHSSGSSNSLITSSPGMIPSHTISISGIHPSGIDTTEGLSGQPTPPLVSSQPSQRPGFSTHSSSSHFSPSYHHPSLDQFASSPSFRPLASLPRHQQMSSNVEFGTIDAKLDNYQFDFPTLQSSSYGQEKRGIQLGITRTGDERVNADARSSLFGVLDQELLFQLPNLISQKDNPLNQTSEQLSINHTNLEPFQPTFNLDFELIANGILSAADLAGPVDPSTFSFNPHYDSRNEINQSNSVIYHENNTPKGGNIDYLQQQQQHQQTANTTNTTATTHPPDCQHPHQRRRQHHQTHPHYYHQHAEPVSEPLNYNTYNTSS